MNINRLAKNELLLVQIQHNYHLITHHHRKKLLLSRRLKDITYLAETQRLTGRETSRQYTSICIFQCTQIRTSILSQLNYGFMASDIILIMSKCQLQLIDRYPYDLSKQNNYMTLHYTCFVDPQSAQTLQIIGHGFRYLCLGNDRKLVMVVIDNNLGHDEEAIVVKVPMTVYQWCQNTQKKALIIRQPIGLITPILPKLQATKEINVYFNANFKVDPALVKFLSNCDFVCQTGEYYIDCIWLKPILSKFKSIRERLTWQAEISKQSKNKYLSYLRVYIQVIEKGEQPFLFRKGETQLTIKSQALHPYNIYRTIKLDPLEAKIFAQYHYTEALTQIGRTQIRSELIILQTERDIGVERCLQVYSQDTLLVNFRCIDCQLISSTKQFWGEFESICSWESSIILIRNISWIEELYQSEHVLNFQIKQIMKRLEKQFSELFHKSLRQYCLIIEQVGQEFIGEGLQNARVASLKIEKIQKALVFARIFQEFDKQYEFREEVIQQFHDKFGWEIFLNFFLTSWKSVRLLPKNDIFKKLRELVKQEQVQNLIEVSWDDVGGLQTAKQEIVQTVLLPIKHPEIFDEWIRPRTGLLFYGPPGTGKTLLGKCVAKECKMSFISVKGPQLLNMYVGQSQKNVRSVFQRARSCSPCIIFMDELDALVPKRGNSGDSNQVMDRIVAQLLQQMDTASSYQVFIIGATNRPDLLDPSILRPGRFDKQIYLGITQAKQDRIKIIKAQTRHLTLQQNLNWDSILEKIPKNFTGADFYGLTSKAVMAAAERTIEQYEQGILRERITLTQQDFLAAIPGIKPSVTEADLAKYQTLKQIYS